MKSFLLATLLVFSAPAWAQSSAFTYQGELEQSGIPATGEFDFEFALFNDSLGSTQIAGPFTVEDVFVDGGLFQAEVDFGASVFEGNDTWLEIRVRPGSSSDAFIVMTPRQRVTPAPLALSARTVAAESIGTVQIAPGAVTGSKIDSSQVQLRVGSGCSPGSSIRGIDADGTVECETDDDSGGDITGVSVTSPGLTGGGDNGDVSVAVDFSSVQARVDAGCAAGSAIRSIAQDGTVNCEIDDFEPAETDPFDGVLIVGPQAFEEDRGHQNTLLFQWNRDFRGWLYLNSSGSSPPNRGDFFVPVQLPAGATITRLTSYFYDDDPTGNVQIIVRLRKRGPTETEGTLIADAFSFPTSGQSSTILTQEDPSISDPVVDKNAFYWLSLIFKLENVASSTELRFYGARIEYTMP